MINEIIEKTKKQIKEVIELAEEDLKSVKTGRAKPSLIENIKVQAYEGASMDLKELASISAPDPHSLVISPWDKTIVEAIEKAINISGLNLHAVVDSDVIRIKIPSLTEEGRRDLVKLVSQKLESSRKLLRQVRNENKKQIDNLKGESGISEDDIKTGLEELQKLVDEFNSKIEELGRIKEKELMTI